MIRYLDSTLSEAAKSERAVYNNGIIQTENYPEKQKNVEHLCDDMQFAYKQNRCIDDDVTTLIHMFCVHILTNLKPTQGSKMSRRPWKCL